MHVISLIVALIGNFVIFQMVSDGEALSRIELTIGYVVTSTLLVVFAHIFFADLRYERPGKALELFGFLAAIVGLVATGTASQNIEATEDYEQARSRVISERAFIRELVDEFYNPHCEGWGRRARVMSRELPEAPASRSFEERDGALMAAFNELDQSCFMLVKARSVIEDGDFDKTIKLFRSVRDIGVIQIDEDAIRTLEEYVDDPFILEAEAEQLRERSKILDLLAEIFGPLSNFLILMALSVGAGRTGFLAFVRNHGE